MNFLEIVPKMRKGFEAELHGCSFYMEKEIIKDRFGQPALLSLPLIEATEWKIKKKKTLSDKIITLPLSDGSEEKVLRPKDVKEAIKELLDWLFDYGGRQVTTPQEAIISVKQKAKEVFGGLYDN